MIAIYKIINLINNKVYIGSSINLEIRLKNHKAKLRNNHHSNQYLQRSWDKYGENNFKFEIIEECKKEEIINKEQYWIDYYKSYDENNGYNLSPTAGNILNYKMNEEQKNKISKALMGHKLSEETKQKISKTRKERKYKISKKHLELLKKLNSENNPNAKLKKEDVIKIRQLYKSDNYTYKELSDLYNVTCSCIKHIIYNRTWKNLEKEN